MRSRLQLICLLLCYQFLDSDAWMAVKSLNKIIKKSLAAEERVLNKDNHVFLHGAGIKSLV